jgi:hypothetical protein
MQKYDAKKTLQKDPSRSRAHKKSGSANFHIINRVDFLGQVTLILRNWKSHTLPHVAQNG